MMRLFIVLFSFLLLSSGISSKFSEESLVTVTVTGISKVAGDIRMGVYANAAAFPIAGKQYKGYVFAVTEKKMVLKLSGLPAGTYAIALYQDEDKNGKLNKNALGLPLEKYGFSNNARATFSAPSFKSAAFQHHQNTAIAIKNE